MAVEEQTKQEADRQANEEPAQNEKPRRLKFPTREQFDRLVKKANDGERKAQAILRRILDSYPQVWEEAGSLAAHAEMALIRLISQGEWFLGESLKRKLADLRNQLTGLSPSPLEELAVERVIACWTHLYYVETVCLEDGNDLAERNYWLKRQDQAHRRFTSAIKSLVMIRTLLPAGASAGAGLTRRIEKLEGALAALPRGDAAGGNGRAGVSSISATGTEHDAVPRLTKCSGQVNRIAALTGAAQRLETVS